MEQFETVSGLSFKTFRFIFFAPSTIPLSRWQKVRVRVRVYKTIAY
jgi:hypothetical protein